MVYRDKAKQKAYHKEWTERNRDKRRAANRRAVAKLKLWFKEVKAKLRLKCNRCPENHPATLVFHHTDPEKKGFTISARFKHYGRQKVLEEIAKCEVLCANCHAKEHWTAS